MHFFNFLVEFCYIMQVNLVYCKLISFLIMVDVKSVWIFSLLKIVDIFS